MARNWTLIRLGAALIVAALIAAVAATAARPAEAQAEQLLFLFRGSVERGPSAGTTLEGDLALTPNADGTVAGALSVGDTDIPVTGRLAAGNLSVTFDLGGGAYIFGIGSLGPSGNFRGPFVGPQGRDFGSWKAEPITNLTLDFRGSVERGPSAGTTLEGPLSLRIIDGRFTGTFLLGGTTSIPVRGRLPADGNPAQLIITFDLGNGVTIVGTGNQTEDGGFAGPFRGPGEGDRGSWTASPAQ